MSKTSKILKFLSPKHKYKQCPLVWKDGECPENFMMKYEGRKIDYDLNKNLWNILEDNLKDIKAKIDFFLKSRHD